MAKRGSLKEYSLADVTVTVSTDDTTLIINSKGENIGSIGWSRKENANNITGDASGGRINNISYNKTGTIRLTLNQTSFYVKPMQDFQNLWESDNREDYMATITITHNKGNFVVTGRECIGIKTPDETYADTASEIDFEIDCGILDVEKEN